VISVFGSKVGAEELRQVRSTLEAQWMGIGPKTKAFEAAFTKRLGLSDLALVDSGSNGLYLAVKLLGLPRGSEVIVPSLTWISCAHAVLLAGCVPVFCDVELDTQNASVDTIEPCLTPRTGAIMVVHYAGKPVDMDGVLGLGHPVIEDAAHAVDSRIDGRACGSMGTLGVYSFDAVKNLAMGEGGGLTARDPELVARARLLRYCGIGKSGFQASADKARWWEYAIVDVMPKLLPNDVAASIGLAQLAKLDALQAYRKRIWERYQHEFAQTAWLVRPQDPGPRDQHSYFTYFVRVPGGRRDRLAKYLYDKGIYTTLRYHPLHMNEIYKSTARLPHCEQLNEEGLNLPLHPNLSDTDVDQVLSAMRSFGG
jgi:dTDP-4-amino-4,6-dideoxygalactose transaminase